jgi:hypothetical protein
MRHLAACCELCRTACLALFASVQSSQAGTVSGTFQGIADIEVQQFVPGQQIGPTASYQNVPSMLGFTITTGSVPFSGTLRFDFESSLTSLNTAALPQL